jgi:hypothetical protein
LSESDQRRIDALIGDVFGEGEEAELVRAAIKESLGATKRVRQQQRCPKCSTVFRGEFTQRDQVNALKTIEFLADRLAGRPGVQKDDGDNGALIFVNKTVFVDADGMNTVEWLAKYGLLSKPVKDVRAEWTLGHSVPADQAARLAALERAAE